MIHYIIGNNGGKLIENWITRRMVRSIIGQMLKLNGTVLQFSTDIISLVHYVEQLGVPYRQLKRLKARLLIKMLMIVSRFYQEYAWKK